MADPAPTRRRAPVGYRFRPTEEELVAHYLRHKLMADDPSIYNTIPEIDVCKHEPWDLLALAASAFPEIDPDDSECYFFSPRDYKYTNSTRCNRTTSLGYWKVTGRDRKLRDRDTNNVIGTKKNLVFYMGRSPRGIKYNWVIYEYDNITIPPLQRIYVLCRLMKKYEKKIKGKIIDCDDGLIHDEKDSNIHVDFEHENQANIYVESKESYPSNMDSMVSTSSLLNEPIKTSYHPNELINSSLEIFYHLNEPINSSLETSYHPNEPINSSIEFFYHPNEPINSSFKNFYYLDESINSSLEISYYPNKPINLSVESSYHLNETISSIQTQTQSQSNEVIDSTIQALFQPNGVISQEFNSTMEAPFGFDSEEFYNSLLLLPAPATDEQGLGETVAPSYMLY